VLSLGAVFALLNIPLLRHPDIFRHSFEREMEFVVQGHKGMTRSVPHSAYTAAFSKNLTPVLWVGLIAFYTLLIRRRREVPVALWLTAGWPVLYVILLSCSPKENDRYFMPATVVFTVLAAAGLGLLADLLHRNPRVGKLAATTLFSLMLALALAIQLPRTWEYYQAFKADDRRDLANWLRERYPAGSPFVQDSRAKMPPPNATLPFIDVSKGRFAADAGSLETLRRDGVRFLIVSESDYGRFFRESLKPSEAQKDDYQRRKKFYEELHKQGQLLWERPRSKVIYLHPGLKVFELQGQDKTPSSTL
jgi:hypothetical protein